MAIWPKSKLDMPPARIPWTLSWSQFTRALRDDVDACIERFAATDLDDEDAPDKPLRPVTLKWRRFQIRMAASSLVAAGVPVGEIRSLADVVRPQPFNMVIKNLRARYGKKTGNIYGLATALKSIAAHYCKLTESELNQLRRICRKNLFKQRGTTKKNSDRLRPFTDPDTRDRLLLLPQDLMQDACKATEPDRSSAVTAELAVALEIGQMAPLRMANLAALEIRRHLHFIGRGRGEHAVIALPEDKVKNEIALEYPLPPESTHLIKLYIARFRPLLGPPESMFLFPSPRGGAKRPTTLSRRITAAVREATGHRIHGHLLRHLAATIYLQAYPGAYEAVSRILGHRTASAALNMYVGLETAAAARHFDEVILRHRRLAAQREGHRGRRMRR